MEILKTTPDLTLILPKVFLFVTETLIFARIFIKISLLKTYIATRKLDFICLSDTYLDSSILYHDNNLETPSYDSFRADHPSNTKRGGGCIYYRKPLPLKILNILYLHECINSEIRLGGKLN